MADDPKAAAPTTPAATETATAGSTPAAPVAGGVPPPPASSAAADATKAASPDPTAAAPAAPVVPETYALTLPKDSLLDAGAVTRLSEKAKALKLSQEAAQGVLEHSHAEVVAYQARQQAAFAETTKGWVDVVKADPELGGAHYEETLLRTTQFMERFATPEFKQALNETGFGNHPELVRTLARAAKAMGEASLVRPGSETRPTPKSYEQLLYPENAPAQG